MARPPKYNADYFAHDANMRNDRRIKALRKEFSHLGYSVYICMLEALTGSNNFELDFSYSEILLWSADFGCSAEELRNIVDLCLKIGLLQKKGKSTIWSKDLIDSLTPLINKRMKDRERIIAAKTCEKDDKRNDNSNKGSIIAAKTCEKDDYSSESTQSKVKKSKDNNSLRSSLSPSTPSSSVCVCDGGQEEIGDIPMTAREGIEVLKNDRDWLLQMQRKFGLEAGVIVRWLDNFSVDCDCRGKQEHESLADVKQHFNDWMSKQKPKRTGGKKGDDDVSAPLTSLQRWNKCHAELCQAVSPEECSQSFDVIRFERFEVSTSKLFILVPNKETYEYMEHHLVDVMSRIIPKYFGVNFKLQYHLP